MYRRTPSCKHRLSPSGRSVDAKRDCLTITLGYFLHDDQRRLLFPFPPVSKIIDAASTGHLVKVATSFRLNSTGFVCSLHIFAFETFVWCKWDSTSHFSLAIQVLILKLMEYLGCLMLATDMNAVRFFLCPFFFFFFKNELCVVKCYMSCGEGYFRN